MLGAGASAIDVTVPKATGFGLAAYPLAMCLDGSPGRYYLRPAAAANDSDRWLV